MNWLLIGLNVVAWLYEYGYLLRGASWFVPWYGFVPSRFLADPQGEWPTVLSSMFLHGGWAHLGGNLLFLWIFGDNVEDSMGSRRYLAFYLLGGVAAAGAQLAVDPHSSAPMVGASGAISAVLGAYMVQFPRAPVSVLNPVPLLWLTVGPLLALPAWVVIGTWFVLDNLLVALGQLGQAASGGVAFWAHIGGFLCGLVLVKVFTLGRDSKATDPWDGWNPPPRPHRTALFHDDRLRDPWN